MNIPSSNLSDCSSWNFSGGERTTEDYAWFCANNSVDEVKEVGVKIANNFGLYDMHGNVNEWCHDWYQSYYPIGTITDPAWLITTSDRVIRGGKWTDNLKIFARTPATLRYLHTGFLRLAFALYEAYNLGSIF